MIDKDEVSRDFCVNATQENRSNLDPSIRGIGFILKHKYDIQHENIDKPLSELIERLKKKE
ncbi:hypothetical protein ACI0FM_12575 [Paenochrobactrum sp. BZR 588]|uniref:hypothetical protein n=1 Tax=unclassified Paenochrobactrum TaxID=2639760 RepID=UPI003853011E